MSINYRVVRKKYEHKIGDEVRVEFFYGIHEVYYDNAGVPVGVTVDAEDIGSETIEDLIGMYVQMKSAFQQPILDFDNIPEPGYNKNDEMAKALLDDVNIDEELAKCDSEDEEAESLKWTKEDSDNYHKEKNEERLEKEERYNELIKDIIVKKGWNYDFKMEDFYRQ